MCNIAVLRSIKGITFGVFAAIIWGAFPVVTAQGLQQSLSLFDITAIRFLTAGIILLPVLIHFGLPKMPILAMLVLVCGAGAPYLMIAAWGLTFAPATHFGVIAPSCMVLFTVLGGWWWLAEGVGLRRVIGVSAIVFGVIFIGWEGLRVDVDRAWLGDVIFILAGLFWAAFTLVSRRYRVAPLQAISLISVLSMIIYFPLYALLSPSPFWHYALDILWIQILYQGVFSGVLALLFFTQAVQSLGAGRGALFGAMAPAFTLVIVFVAYSQLPSVYQMIGALLVTAGMFLAVKRIASDPSVAIKG